MPKEEKASLNYIFKDSVSVEEQNRIIGEAEAAMLEVNQILGIELSEKFDCVFDSGYKNGRGQNRSEARYQEKTIYCVRYTDFVHEYIHMLFNLSPDRVYHPNAILTEGTATYFSLIWGEEYGNNYTYLYDGKFQRFQNKSEDETMCKLLEASQLTLNERNYDKATIAYMEKVFGAHHYQTLDQDIINYRIGAITVEYLVTQCGGVETFLSVYFDAIRIPEVYAKSLDDIIPDAIAWNSEMFS